MQYPRRTVRLRELDGEGDPRELGSVAWQRRRESSQRHYSRERELKRFYRILPKLTEAIDHVNTSGTTETGRALAPLMITVLELERGLLFLNGMQRLVWRLVVMGIWKQRLPDGTWREVRVGRVSLEEAGTILGMHEKAVSMHVSRSTRVLVGRIYDPMPGEWRAA